MIWTLILFFATMFVLYKFAFPPIARGAREARRARCGRTSTPPSGQREEADELLAEYRQRLKEAREQADDIVARARKASEAAVAEATADGKAKREELVAAARRDIEAETRRSLEQIRKEVADLTVLATEKVTRKSLDDADQKRLVEEALAEVDFSALGAEARRGGQTDGGDRPRICPGAVRGGAGRRQARRGPRAAGRVRRCDERVERHAGVLLRPYFSSTEKRDAIKAAVSGADRRARQLPRAARREAPDAGDLPHPQPLRRALGRGEEAARGDADERGRARPRSSTRSARRSSARPTARST